MKDLNFKPERHVNGLPVGGYVLKILDAVEEHHEKCDMLKISFDIAEGDFAGYFRQLWNDDTREDKKWKGVLRLFIPNEKSEYFVSQQKRFGDAIACIEESNDGFAWSWNESELKDKLVGGLFRSEEWEFNGKTGWAVRCYGFRSVEEIRQGRFRLAHDKPLKNKTISSEMFTDVQDIPKTQNDAELELPF